MGLAMPEILDELKLAVSNAADNLPLQTIQDAVGNLRQRLKLRIDAGGRQFSHMLKRKNLPNLDFDLAAAALDVGADGPDAGETASDDCGSQEDPRAADIGEWLSEVDGLCGQHE